MKEQEELELLRRFVVKNFDISSFDARDDGDDILNFKHIFNGGDQCVHIDDEETVDIMYAYIRAHRQEYGSEPRALQCWGRRAGMPQQGAVTEETDRALADAYVRALREQREAEERAAQARIEVSRKAISKERGARAAREAAEIIAAIEKVRRDGKRVPSIT